ncbi:MAG: helix-turn-helix transcriptional regulator [Tissierellia bacterium]|nr:helix-turn-helix transcriptional regulator [Tissierellia bacterium]
MEMKNDVMRNISKNLRYYMDLHSINNRELAEVLGVSESTVGKWLLEKSVPRMGVIEKIANYFEIQKSDILENKPHESTEPEGMYFRIDLSKYPKEQRVEMEKELINYYNFLKSKLEDE